MTHLRALPETYAVSRFPAGSPIPSPVPGGLWSATATDTEVSVLAAGEGVPGAAAVEAGWRCWEVAGPLDFAAVGVLSGLTEPLAGAGVSIFAISTYDTDYLLVQAAQWRHAQEVLVAAGHDAPAFPE